MQRATGCRATRLTPSTALYDLSQLLHTGTSTRLRVPSEQVAIMLKRSGLDKQTLSICVGMIEAGANPDTLAVSLRRVTSLPGHVD